MFSIVWLKTKWCKLDLELVFILMSWLSIFYNFRYCLQSIKKVKNIRCFNIMNQLITLYLNNGYSIILNPFDLKSTTMHPPVNFKLLETNLQWCFLTRNPKLDSHSAQWVTAWSGTQRIILDSFSSMFSQLTSDAALLPRELKSPFKSGDKSCGKKTFWFQ